MGKKGLNGAMHPNALPLGECINLFALQAQTPKDSRQRGTLHGYLEPKRRRVLGITLDKHFAASKEYKAK